MKKLFGSTRFEPSHLDHIQDDTVRNLAKELPSLNKASGGNNSHLAWQSFTKSLNDFFWSPEGPSKGHLIPKPLLEDLFSFKIKPFLNDCRNLAHSALWDAAANEVITEFDLAGDVKPAGSGAVQTGGISLHQWSAESWLASLDLLMHVVDNEATRHVLLETTHINSLACRALNLMANRAMSEWMDGSCFSGFFSCPEDSAVHLIRRTLLTLVKSVSMILSPNRRWLEALDGVVPEDITLLSDFIPGQLDSKDALTLHSLTVKILSFRSSVSLFHPKALMLVAHSVQALCKTVFYNKPMPDEKLYDLVIHLGWPSCYTQAHRRTFKLAIPNTSMLALELDIQVSLINLLRSAVPRHVKEDYLLSQCVMDRITESILWTSYFLPALEIPATPERIAQVIPNHSKANSPINPHVEDYWNEYLEEFQVDRESYVPIMINEQQDMKLYQKQPSVIGLNQHMLTLTNVIEKLLLCLRRHAKKSSDKKEQSSEGQPWQRLLYAMVSTFDSDQALYSSAETYKARQAMQRPWSEIQFYIIDALANSCLSIKEAAQNIRQHGFIGLLFTEFFFCMENDTSSTEDMQVKLSNMEYISHMQSSVMEFIMFLSSINNGSNYTECLQIFQVLRQSLDNPNLCSQVLSCLLRMLVTNTDMTRQALINQNVFPTLFDAAEHFATIDATEALKTLLEIFDILFASEEMSSMILNSLPSDFLLLVEENGEHDVTLAVKLFHLLRCPATVRFALHHIGSLICKKVAPELLPKRLMLVQQIVQTIGFVVRTRARECGEAGMCLTDVDSSLLLEIFRVIAWCVRKGGQEAVEMFLTNEVFVQILSVLNVPEPIHDARPLCIGVLRLIKYFLRNSRSNREMFSQVVGYDQLVELVLMSTRRNVEGEVLDAAWELCLDRSLSRIVIPEALVFVFDIVRRFGYALQIQAVEKLNKLLSQETLSNRAECCEHEINSYLLQWMGNVSSNSLDESMLKPILLQSTEMLGAYRSTVKDLKVLFGQLRPSDADFRPMVGKFLIQSLQRMTTFVPSPASGFFDFHGPNACLSVQRPLHKMSRNDGYTVCMWLCLQQAVGRGKKQVVFSTTSPSLGGSRVLVALDDENVHYFVIQPQSGHSEVLTFCLKPKRFIPGKLCLLTVTHSSGRFMSASQAVTVYLNKNPIGKPKPCSKFPDLERSTAIFGNVDAHDAISDHGFDAFSGQMTACYMFRGLPIAAVIERLHDLGPDGMMLPSSEESNDGSSAQMTMAFSPRAFSGRTFFDLVGDNLHAYNSIAKGELQSLVSVNVRNMIECVGGIRTVYPLFGQLDMPIDVGSSSSGQSDSACIDYTIDPELSFQVMGLLSSIIKNSRAGLEDLRQSHGFCAIAYLLRSVSPVHMTKDMLEELMVCYKIVKHDPVLSEELICNILLDMRLWMYSPIFVQMTLWNSLLKMADNPEMRENIRAWFGIEGCVDVLRRFLWIDRDERSECGDPFIHPLTKEVLGHRPCQIEIWELRGLVLSLMQNITRRNPSKQEMFLLSQYVCYPGSYCHCYDTLPVLCQWVSTYSTSKKGRVIDVDFSFGLVSFLELIQNHDSRLTVLPALSHLFRIKVVDRADDQLACERTCYEGLITSKISMNSIFSAASAFLGGHPISTIADLCSPQQPVQTQPAFFRLLIDLTMHLPDTVAEMVLASLHSLVVSEERVRFSLLQHPKYPWQNSLVYSLCHCIFKNRSEGLISGVRSILAALHSDLIAISKDGWTQVKHSVQMCTMYQDKLKMENVESVPRMILLDLLKFGTMTLSVLEEKPTQVLLDNLQYLVIIADHWILDFPSRALTEEPDISDLNPEECVLRRDESGSWLDESLCSKVIDFAETLLPLQIKVGHHWVKDSDVTTVATSKARRGVLSSVLRLIRVKVLLSPDDETYSQTLSKLAWATGIIPQDVSHKEDLLSSLGFLHLQGFGWRAESRSSRLIAVLQSLHASVLKKESFLRQCCKEKGVEMINPSKFQDILEETTDSVGGVQGALEQMYYVSNWGFDPVGHILMHAHSSVKSRKGIFDYEKLSRRLEKSYVKHVSPGTSALVSQAKGLGLQFRSEHALKAVDTLDSRLARLRRRDEENAMRWQRAFRSVSNERGPWPQTNRRMMYRLDRFEGIHRMRRRLKLNYDACFHTEASKKAASKNDLIDEPESLSSKVLSGIKLPMVKADVSKMIDDEEQLDEEDLADKATKFKGHAILVRPRGTRDGTLTLTGDLLQFTPQDDGIKDPEERRRRQMCPCMVMPKEEPLIRCKTYRINVDNIVEVHRRRYTLRWEAVEIFLRSGHSFFFSLGSKQNMIRFMKRIDKVLPSGSQKYVESSSAIMRNKLQDATERWVKREISNFAYLMILNTLAGRTYQDMAQYPVMPWVLKDYESDELHIDNPDIYRDLSKPIGAMDEARVQQCIERYNMMDDPQFMQHHNVHYSSPAIVMGFLVRMEPFTTMHIELQSGKFDHADRLFKSVPGAWKSVQKGSQDLRELIPEFFYMPEFLRNGCHFNFGRLQNGNKVDDVELPPWAKGSADEFVRLHRDALESEYVSRHLHEWIDLIFGYKQKGHEAEAAINIFKLMTYEGGVDQDAVGADVDGEQRLKAVHQEINQFGQTPVQLFSKRHPSRHEIAAGPSKIPSTHPHTSSLFNLGSSFNVSAVQVVGDQVKNSKVYTISRDRTLRCHPWTDWHVNFEGRTCPLEINKEVAKHKIGTAQVDRCDFNSAFAIAPDGRHVFSCAHWDNDIYISDVNTGRTTHKFSFHKDLVTCIVLAEEGRLLISGSADTTVLTWELPASSASHWPKLPKHVLFGHDDQVSSLAANSSMDLVASGSQDGTVILHELRRGKYIRTISPNSSRLGRISMLKITSLGDLVFIDSHEFKLYHYSMNGQMLACVDATAERPSAMLIHYARGIGELVVTCGERGKVYVRNINQKMKTVARRPISDAEGNPIYLSGIEVAPDQRHVILSSYNQILVVPVLPEAVSALSVALSDAISSI